MAWVRIDDGFADHPKLVRAGPLAMVAHLRALCYAARQLTDGVIPPAVAESFFADLRRLDRRLGPAWMVKHRLWDRTRRAYKVHDFLLYNPHREDVLRLRALRQEFGRRGGLSKAANSQLMCLNGDTPHLDSKPSKPPSKLPTKRPTKTPSQSLPRPQPLPQPLKASSEKSHQIASGLTQTETNGHRLLHPVTPQSAKTLLEAQVRAIAQRHPELTQPDRQPEGSDPEPRPAPQPTENPHEAAPSPPTPESDPLCP